MDVALRQPSLQALAALLQAIDANRARGRVLAVVDHPLLAGTLREQAPDLATAATSAETNAFLTTRRFASDPLLPAGRAGHAAGGQPDQQAAGGRRPRPRHSPAGSAEQPSVAAVQALIDAGVDGVIVTDPALIAGLSWPGQAP